VRKLFSTLVFASFILAACSGTPTQPAAAPVLPRPTPNSAELKLSDSAQTVEVSAGSEFTITVETNLPSNYHWELSEALDAAIIEYVWKDYVPDNSGNPNTSGRDVWRFKAVAPGKTNIMLGYYQGMTDYAPRKQVFNIVVK
jgi:predicted secreted protein